VALLLALALVHHTQPTYSINSVSRGAVDIQVRSSDNPLLPMPAGTTITAEASGLACAVDKSFGSPVVNVQPGTNPSADLSTGFVVTLKTCAAGDTVFIKIKSPSGLETSIPFRLP
jgi:hypothetical protein